MRQQTTDKNAKVTPLFELTSPEGSEQVKTFDKAWQRSHELCAPVDVTLLKWVRVD